MKLLYTLYVVIIIFENMGVYGDSANNNNMIYSINDKVSSCSGWLATIIFNFCNNTYKIVKRDTSLILDKITPKSLQESINNKRLLAERRWRRVRRQVANECCLRPCTVADIIRYCPSDAKLLQEHPDIFD